MLRLLLHSSLWKVLLWGKKERRKDGKINRNQRGNKREREGVRNRRGSGKSRFEMSALQ